MINNLFGIAFYKSALAWTYFAGQGRINLGLRPPQKLFAQQRKAASVMSKEQHILLMEYAVMKRACSVRRRNIC